MRLNFENIAIILGALAVAYAINKVVKDGAALTSINNVQYAPVWSDAADQAAGVWV